MSKIYNILFRRNSVFISAIFGAAFFVDIGFNSAVDKYFDYVNQGKQWKDIKHNYIKSGEDEE
ncbi:hypothetical protein DASB73_018510 [Starmerella bacillaris]|uniref:Complex III subunit 9 n=1 Tax=Starmerella bacillaris TaxID=1247836 RepID=A0AAV5RJI9_STABA|nr:hypothetical protein DASB73_018510 [Starmerella bacillaris]